MSERDYERYFNLDGVICNEEPIAEGAYGSVRTGEWHGLPVAMKEPHLWFNEYRDTEVGQKALRNFENEAHKWALCLRHKNIVQFYGLWQTPNGNHAIVMELMATSLHKFLNESKASKDVIPVDLQRSILLDVSRAMTYLHSVDLIHRDLSTNNVLLTSHYVAKVSDFGTLKVYAYKDQEQSKCPGTPAFTPPEARGSNYSEKVDVFAFGCILLHVLTHIWPDENGSAEDSEWKKREYLVKELTLEQENEFGMLIQQCLDDVPENRPTFADIAKQISQRPHVTDAIVLRIMQQQMDQLRAKEVMVCPVLYTCNVSYIASCCHAHMHKCAWVCMCV